MKENRGAGSWERSGVGIMSDKELERVRVIVLSHLRFLLPQRSRLVVEDEMSVVM